MFMFIMECVYFCIYAYIDVRVRISTHIHGCTWVVFPFTCILISGFMYVHLDTFVCSALFSTAIFIGAKLFLLEKRVLAKKYN